MTMKYISLVILLLSEITFNSCFYLQRIDELNLCDGELDNTFFPDPTDCKKFFACRGGKMNVATCPPMTSFNPETRICDSHYICPYDVSSDVATTLVTTTFEASLISSTDIPTTATTTTIEAEMSTTSEDIISSSSTSLSELFQETSNGETTIEDITTTSIEISSTFNPITSTDIELTSTTSLSEVTTFSEIETTTLQDTTILDPSTTQLDETTTTEKVTTETEIEDITTTTIWETQPVDTTTTPKWETTVIDTTTTKVTTVGTTIDPSVEPGITCPIKDNANILFIPSNLDCERYYICYHSKPVQMTCLEGMHWNQKDRHCDWPDKVQCSVDIDPDASNFPKCNSEGRYFIPHPTFCGNFIYCDYGNLSVQQCDAFYQWDVLKERCIIKDRATCVLDIPRPNKWLP